MSVTFCFSIQWGFVTCTPAFSLLKTFQSPLFKLFPLLPLWGVTTYWLKHHLYLLDSSRKLLRATQHLLGLFCFLQQFALRGSSECWFLHVCLNISMLRFKSAVSFWDLVHKISRNLWNIQSLGFRIKVK